MSKSRHFWQIFKNVGCFTHLFLLNCQSFLQIPPLILCHTSYFALILENFNGGGKIFLTQVPFVPHATNSISGRPAQLTELPRSKFDPEILPHSAYVKFFVTVATKVLYLTFCDKMRQSLIQEGDRHTAPDCASSGGPFFIGSLFVIMMYLRGYLVISEAT